MNHLLAGQNAGFASTRSVDPLWTSGSYNFDPVIKDQAYEECRDCKLDPKMDSLLEKMGNHRNALTFIASLSRH